MAVPPNPPTISGQITWTPVDHAAVALDGAKLAQMPGSLYETDGYRERLDEHGWEVIRVFTCSWSDVALAMQWFYGYSTLSSQDQENALNGFDFNGKALTRGKALGDEPGLAIQRVIPAQDPYRPYLFCDHVELVEGGGAFVQDPGLFFRDQNGDLMDLTGAIVPGTTPYEDGRAKDGSLLPGVVRVPGMVYAEKVGGIVWPGPIGGPVYPFPGQLGGGPVTPSSPGQPPPPPLPTGTWSEGMAKLRVKYRPRPYVVMNDTALRARGLTELSRYVERRPNFAIQGIPLNVLQGKDQLKFHNPNGSFDQQIIAGGGVLLMPTASFIYRWVDVPFYPIVAIDKCMGKVNDETFDGVSGWPSFAAQTLLCQAPNIDPPRRNASGQMSFDISWRLDFRPAGWNFFPAADGNFYQATFKGDAPAGDGSNLVFKPADFDVLFQVQSPAFWG